MNQKEILKKYFGYDHFRSGQEEMIETILSGRDALAIMPTGAGKSLCYQVPGLMLPGITLVISPLISLMQDQVQALNEAGVHAAYINSSLTERQIAKALQLASEGVYKVIYAAPERLVSPGFIEFSHRVEISMVTVDEAHCISQWGQDFRPSYLKIVDFVNQLPRRPILSAFTATATETVKKDIEVILKLRNPRVVITGFDRKNLYYSVEQTGKKDDFVVDYVEQHPQDSGIIYCATRKNVDMLFEMLFKRGIPVAKYHAGLSSELRKKYQEEFIFDRTPVIVATNAFGMGIDKSNVRYVIHYNMPQSMENYYQEAGRAGRDGEPSRCILLFSPQDIVIQKFLLERKNFEGIDEADIEDIRRRDLNRLQIMEDYCRTTGCLRNYILNYFGEQAETPCDNCGNCDREYTETDMTQEAQWVIRCVTEAGGRYGLTVILGTLLGSNRTRLKSLGTVNYESFGQLKDCSEFKLRLLIGQMLKDGYLYRTQDQYSLLKIGESRTLPNESDPVIVRTYEKNEPVRRSRTRKKRRTESLRDSDHVLFESLRSLRTEIAKEEAVPPYIVFSDKTLIDMCAKMPSNKIEMLEVSGVGEKKYEKYGERFLRLTAGQKQQKK